MSVLQGVGSVLSGMTGLFGLNGKQQNKVFEQNKELARLSNQYNVQQWNREMAYNHPVAQRQRLRQAGLNPDLVYQNGLDNLAPNSPQLSSGEPMQMFDRSAEVREGILSSANVLLSGAQAVGQSLDNSDKEISLITKAAEKQAELETKKAGVKSAQARADIDETQAEIERTVKESKIKRVQTETDIAAEQLAQERVKTDIVKIDKDVRKDLNDAELLQRYTNSFKAMMDAGLSAQQSKALMQQIVINAPVEGIAKSDAAMQDWLRNYLGDKGISVLYGVKDMAVPLIALAKLFVKRGK